MSNDEKPNKELTQPIPQDRLPEMKAKKHLAPPDPNLVKRLKRASGHLEATIKMVDAGRSCTEVLQQLTAVISALNGSRVLLLSTHINKCLKPLLASDDEGIVKDLEIVLQRAMRS